MVARAAAPYHGLLGATGNDTCRNIGHHPDEWREQGPGLHRTPRVARICRAFPDHPACMYAAPERHRVNEAGVQQQTR